MIVGMGTDLVLISRMEESIARKGEKFAQRLLTEEEFEIYITKVNQAAFLAKRFAAKEAAVKALGTGFAQGITWKQVNVSNNDLGAPQLTFTGPALARAESLGVTRIHLSLTDEKTSALAFVVLEAE